VTVVVLTGATRGIGRAAAIELARRGAELVLVGREPERITAAVEAATAVGGGGPVRGHVADLALMSNVRTLADEIRSRYEHVDVLANNAGALFASRRETSEGLEQTFALNHLAPFLLTNLLRDRLAGGRVVTTPSDAHKAGRLDLDDLLSERSYSPRVYGTSKLCNILFTRELARRAPELHANCFHPGPGRHPRTKPLGTERPARRPARRRARLTLPICAFHLRGLSGRLPPEGRSMAR